MFKVAVVGDIILDKNTYGEYRGIRENAPIYLCNEECFQAGGAANVAINLSSLGLEVDLFALVGNDPEKEILVRLLEEKMYIYV